MEALREPATDTPDASMRVPPAPARGGPIALVKFLHKQKMLNHRYLRLLVRLGWLKLRWRGRLKTDGLAFVMPGVVFEIGRDATVSLGRWSASFVASAPKNPANEIFKSPNLLGVVDATTALVNPSNNKQR